MSNGIERIKMGNGIEHTTRIEPTVISTFNYVLADSAKIFPWLRRDYEAMVGIKREDENDKP